MLNHRFVVPLVAVLVIGLGGVMLFVVGRDFFPAIDGGQIKLHVRVPAATRIETTEKIFEQVEDKIRAAIPDRDRDLIVDDIGLPERVYNLAFTDGSVIGPNDGVILVALKDGHAPTADYVRKLRTTLPAAFPDVTFYFQAADMVTQILNFGLPAQIDVRTVGYDRETNLRVAHELQRRIAALPGIADAHLQQEVDAPAFMAKIDRVRALQLGLNAKSIANNINTTLSSSEQVTPNFWTDPKSGIPYYIAVQTPEHQVSSLGELGNTPVSTAISLGGSTVPGLLNNVATFTRNSVPTNLNQTNIQPTYEVYASVAGRDLGSVSDDINKIVTELQRQLSPGNSIQIVGQIQSMNDAFRDLAIGLLFAAVFVYLLMVVNYQNFRRPVRGDPGTAGNAMRDPDDAVHYRDDVERAVPDGRNHGGRCGLGQFHSTCDVRARAATRRQDGIRGGDRRRAYAHPAGVDDRGRHDRRDDPDGDRRRRRRTECRPCAGGHRRSAVCHPDHVAGRPLFVRQTSEEKRWQTRSRRIRRINR